MRDSRSPWGEGRLAAHRGTVGALVALLGACASPEPAAPLPAPPALRGIGLFVRDAADGPATFALNLGTGATERLGAGFPAAADPLGRVALIVQSEGGEDAHQERLCARWLTVGDGDCLPLAPAARFVRNPAWTPDGEAIVFESSAASFRDLWQVSRAGGDPVRLTDAPGGSFDPAVSPDGATLAFASSRDGDLELYRQPLGGGPAQRLTNAVGEDRVPAWRPDGARLAWIAARGDANAVATALPDGSDLARLSPLTDGALAFSWSPDGRRLAVLRASAPGAHELLLVDAVRGLRLASTPAVAANAPPEWTRDGEAVLFSSSAGQESRIAAFHLADSRVSLLTTGPDWLPRVVLMPGG